MPFKPGQSGNPGGKPKQVKELLRLAREKCPYAIEYADRLLRDESEESKIRLEAAKFLCSYGLGAPPKFDIDEPSDEAKLPQGLTVEELRALARRPLPTAPADDAPSDDAQH